MTRRRIQPKPALELETVSLRLPAQRKRVAPVPSYPHDDLMTGGPTFAPPGPLRNTTVFTPAIWDTQFRTSSL
jgi:hypothetical protein